MGLKAKVVDKLATKYNVPKQEIEKAVSFQFKFLRDYAMKELANVRLPYFGVFKINEKKFDKIKELKQNKDSK